MERMGKIARTMKEKMPEILVILVCMLVLGIGVSAKEGYHMDELLSFELSNAAYNPWIVPTQPQGRLAKFVEQELKGDSLGETLGNLKDTVSDVLKNRGNSKLLSYKADVYEEPVWISAETFTDYITVNSGDAFRYLSVYFNVKDDNHPPFHFMLLHTMSSLFQGCVEPIVGCVINMAAVAGILVLLMKLGRACACQYGMEERARAFGIFAALCYGLSTGAMATTLLIRMYAVLAFFCVALLAVHVRKWLEQGFARHNKGLIAITVLGFWTQYFFLFYCLILAVVTGVLLLVKKRREEFFGYVRSMVTAAVIGVGLFPFSVSHVFSSGRGTEALGNLSRGLAGFGERLQAFGTILSGRTFGAGLTIGIVVMALTAGLLLVISKSRGKDASLIGMLLIPTLGYFLLAARMSPYLVDRYMMAIFPIAILAGALLLFWLCVKAELKWKQRGIAYVLCVAVLLIQVWNLTRYDGTYLYRGYREQRAAASERKDYPCICVYDGVGYYENLLEFTQYESTLLVTENELAGRQETASVTDKEKLVLVLKPNVDEEHIMRIMEDKYGFVPEKYVIRDGGAYGDTVVEMKNR